MKCSFDSPSGNKENLYLPNKTCYFDCKGSEADASIQFESALGSSEEHTAQFHNNCSFLDAKMESFTKNGCFKIKPA